MKKSPDIVIWFESESLLEGMARGILLVVLFFVMAGCVDHYYYKGGGWGKVVKHCYKSLNVNNVMQSTPKE